MRHKIVFSILLIFLAACSQVTDEKKVNNEVNKLALTWYQLAEKNRVNHEFSKALKHYKLSYEFALQRNNLRLQLFILARQALVLSRQGKKAQSSEKLNFAKNLLVHEIPEATEEFNILQITVLKNFRQHEEALDLLKSNKGYFKTEEQKIYANWVEHELQSELNKQSSISDLSSNVNNDFNFLYKLYEENKLANIEILGYVGIRYLNILSDNKDPKIEKVLRDMLRFFSEQENATKTSQCYKIAANYYASIAEIEKATYFSEKSKKIIFYLKN
ncbi:hypothetical protein C1E24_03530 [Pseudoalteromonas phenolica]|uniref:Lipoprotein n=1 Tax=Pseudoalteromonas phenolica TaxID=161398 RepID=A0A5R9Q5U7_9GAMM|nr:hypothetical protein [Pseudoalteromonas phenolica]TLX48533.1 hypothetical protein C1E24_03530 [Pseudoalteromonas phenolica]